MSSGTATVVGVVIGAVLGAVFQIVAGFIDAARTKREKNSELRRTAYTVLIEAYDAHRPAVNNLQFALVTRHSDPARVSAASDALQRSYAPISRALAQVEFYGSHEVASAAFDVRRAMGRAAATSLGDKAYRRNDALFEIAYYELMVAMRRDLNLPSSKWHSERLDALHDTERELAEERTRESESSGQG